MKSGEVIGAALAVWKPSSSSSLSGREIKPVGILRASGVCYTYVCRRPAVPAVMWHLGLGEGGRRAGHEAGAETVDGSGSD